MRLGVTIVLLAAACAHKPAPVKVASNAPYSSEGQAKPKGVMRCHMERDTGSNFLQRVCTYADRTEVDSGVTDGMLGAERRAAQHAGPGSGQPNYAPRPGGP